MKPHLKFSIGAVIVMALALQTGSALALGPHFRGVTRTVDDNGADCPGAGYSMIDAALAEAAPGDTVTVCAGYYSTGGLVISSKPGLKLIGKGSPEIVIGSGFDGAIILVEDSSDVTIQGLIINGGHSFAQTSTEMTGISFRNSSGTISNNIISHIRRPDLAPSSFPQGVGIRVYGQNATNTRVVKILNNTIVNVQYAGIWIESLIPLSPYSHDAPGMIVPIISRNLIHTQASGNGVDFTSGIRLEWVMTGSVSNNVIVANSGLTGPRSIGYGIYMHNPARLKITGNTIRAFGFGIVTNTHGAYMVDKNTIANNQIIDGVFDGILFMGGIGGPQLKDNAIQKNKIIVKVPPGGDGIAFTGQERDGMVSGNKVTGNTVQGYNRPITVRDEGIKVSGNKVSPLSPPGA